MNLVGGILYGLVWGFIALLWVRFVVDWVQVFARRWSPSGVLLVMVTAWLLLNVVATVFNLG